MRKSLLHLLACPYCGDRLEIEHVTVTHQEEIWSGTLGCGTCHKSFPVRRGMPFVHREDDSWTSKAREANGWVKIHKQQGIYDPSEAAVDLQIPYYDEEPWTGVARQFDQALARLQLSGDETVLDLGAGRGWAAKQFALLGCDTVALDVAEDENVGLGRGQELMGDAGVYFERVIGDGEHLPFQPRSFDLVFCSAALHHATDLPLLLKNVGQVLKSGAMLCAIREPSLSMIENEEEELARGAVEEMEVGINETRPTYDQYVSALRGAGLSPTLVVPAPGLSMATSDAKTWARDLGAIWAWPDWRAPRRSAWRVWAYGTKRLRALKLGKLQLAADRDSGDERANALAAAARWCTGDLFLLAEKNES